MPLFRRSAGARAAMHVAVGSRTRQLELESLASRHITSQTCIHCPLAYLLLQEADTAQRGGMGRLRYNNPRLKDAGVSWQPSHPIPLQLKRNVSVRILRSCQATL